MAPDRDEQIKFEVVDHTADWALRVYGQDLSQLMENAALGMASLMVGDLGALALEVVRQLELDAFDTETLLVDWLTELAYWAEDEALVAGEVMLSQVTETHLSAVVKCGKTAEMEKHIKAVTYHNLKIAQTEDGLVVTIVFDV
jgi:SHS2 domain-containing protein